MADDGPFTSRGGRLIRLLAVSDEVDPALGHAVNREGLGPLDAIIGCGDLEPDYLAFLADAFRLPLAFARGNHDHGGRWEESRAHAPDPLRTGGLTEVGGLTIAALEWPGARTDETLRHDERASVDVGRVVTGIATRRATGRGGPVVVVSHAPPLGLGDDGLDAYHRGFRAYRQLLERISPPLWLHGHVTPASVPNWRIEHGRTVVANVTGAVVVELAAPNADPESPVSERRPGDGRPRRGGEWEPPGPKEAVDAPPEGHDLCA